MSDSREQSLDENVVFLEVTESSPEFLYSERERQAVERLLSAGPEAFYSSIGTERSGCFLSPEEVRQISSWAQDYRFNQQQVRLEEDGGEGSSQMEDFCSTYFPCTSDTPAPDLDLGWPERGPWLMMGSITVHTSPPADGEPPVREIIRQHLQRATQVIAIVTDRLTDGAIIGDLHNAASRGVPVYIILNQRSIQEDFMLNRLQHPNIRVRVLGGKAFCSRTGKTVVGEMKDNFLLVDLETVIHGSYSLTWTDAHLHRQLITVLRGPVVDSFDQEFRILFAASLPVADTPRVAESHVTVTQKLREFSDLRFRKQLSFDPEILNPPSPPTDSLLDWEAMGVVQREGNFPESPSDQHEEIVFKEISQKNNMLLSKNATIMDDFTSSGNHFVDKKRVNAHNSPVINHVPDKSTIFNIKPSTADLTPERMKRVERIVEKTISRQLSKEKRTNLGDRIMTRVDDKTTEPMHNMVILSSNKRIETSRRGLCVEEESRMDETGSKVENTPSSRKPIILRVPQSESFSSLSDIMKRIQPQQSSSRLLKKESNTAASDLSQSMMDLSVHKKDTHQDWRGVPVPRFKASCFDSSFMTPAFTLMKKRNDDLKSSLYRTSTDFLPRERPRSSAYGLNMDWRRSLAERELGEQE
ncbi:protein FAM83D isoform X2 [Paralichthys olivaceus]|uniref:protein FAM83D isoform X2 n=1 Tax=Paralichthys olivaceus TaxID=8255 RepID=UPI00097D7461|nr:PREDICTED: protein FAM83D-like isoform X2 [Paralichthys olivaceus]